MPMLWPLGPNGYQYDKSQQEPLHEMATHDIPVVTMKELGL